MIFNITKATCEKYKANMYYSDAILWNGLPVHIRNTETYTIFNENNKKWALSQL